MVWWSKGAEGCGFKNPEEVSTLVLLQAIPERVDVPLIAAGEIVDGRGMAAAFALGAEGIQMGTRFVASVKSPVHEHYQQAILSADATGTWVLNKKSTPCIRALKTKRTQVMHESGLMPADAFTGIQQVYFGGDMEAAPALAGQSACLIHEVKAVQAVIDDTVAQFHAVAARMGSLAAASHFG